MNEWTNDEKARIGTVIQHRNHVVLCGGGVSMNLATANSWCEHYEYRLKRANCCTWFLETPRREGVE